jgi:multidrug efflux pump subunit AcrB
LIKPFYNEVLIIWMSKKYTIAVYSPPMAQTMESLNAFTILGLLILIGLVAKNAILVVDFTNQLKATGMELKSVLAEATRKRFRPIIMTTLSMVIGSCPLRWRRAQARRGKTVWRGSSSADCSAPCS